MVGAILVSVCVAMSIANRSKPKKDEKTELFAHSEKVSKEKKDRRRLEKERRQNKRKERLARRANQKKNTEKRAIQKKSDQKRASQKRTKRGEQNVPQQRQLVSEPEVPAVVNTDA